MVIATLLVDTEIAIVLVGRTAKIDHNIHVMMYHDDDSLTIAQLCFKPLCLLYSSISLYKHHFRQTHM